MTSAALLGFRRVPPLVMLLLFSLHFGSGIEFVWSFVTALFPVYLVLSISVHILPSH